MSEEIESDPDRNKNITKLYRNCRLFHHEHGEPIAFGDGTFSPSDHLTQNQPFIKENAVTHVAKTILNDTTTTGTKRFLAKCDNSQFKRLFPGQNQLDSTDENHIALLIFMCRRHLVRIQSDEGPFICEIQYDPCELAKKTKVVQYKSNADFKKRFPTINATILVPNPANSEKFVAKNVIEWYLASPFVLWRERVSKMEPADSRSVLSSFVGIHIDGSKANFPEGDRIKPLMRADRSFEFSDIFQHIHDLVDKNLKDGKLPNHDMQPLEKALLHEYIHSSRKVKSFVHQALVKGCKYDDPFLKIPFMTWLSGPKGLGKSIMLDWECHIYGNGTNAKPVLNIDTLVGGGTGSVKDNKREQGLFLKVVHETSIKMDDKDWKDGGTKAEALKNMTDATRSAEVRSKGKDRTDGERACDMVVLATNHVEFLKRMGWLDGKDRRHWVKQLTWLLLSDAGIKCTGMHTRTDTHTDTHTQQEIVPGKITSLLM